MSPRRMLIWFAFSILVVSPAMDDPDGPQVGDSAPDFTLTATDSLDYTLSNYQGKVVMLMIQGYG